jgi:hypothetical protein
MLYLAGGEKMEAIKIIEDVTSDSITIKNLSKYKGKKVEIIILPYEDEIIKTKKFKSVKGVFKKYANPEFRNKEKEAFAMAMKDKH